MTPHPLLSHFLRIAYECMGCDGEIVDSEVACLRSVAVQLGQPVEEVDGSLRAIGAELSADATGTGSRAREQLHNVGLAMEDAILLLDLLVQMVEADGKVRWAERRYIRDLVDGLGVDRAALRQERPEWRSYLIENVRLPAETEGTRAVAPDAFVLPQIPGIVGKAPKE